MNPFVGKDGSKHTNRSTMQQSNARFAGKSPAMPAAAPGGMDDDMMDQGQGQDMDGAAMAEQHGPATEIRVHHDHEAGKHSVHASHPDGHEHDSEHGSADDAHKFAGELAGVGGAGGEGDGSAMDAGMGAMGMGQ